MISLKRKENHSLISLNKVDAVVRALPEWLQDRFYQPNTMACRVEEKI